MAEIKYRVCDRCEKKIEYKGWTANLFGMSKKRNIFKVRSIYNGNMSGYEYADRHVELCEVCTKQLIDFLDGKAIAEMEK